MVLENKEFSNLSFKRLITQFISESEFKKLYEVYRYIRNDKNLGDLKIEISLIKKLFEVLQREVKNLDGK